MAPVQEVNTKNPWDDQGEDLDKLHSTEMYFEWKLLVSTCQIKRDAFAKFKDLFLCCWRDFTIENFVPTVLLHTCNTET